MNKVIKSMTKWIFTLLLCFIIDIRLLGFNIPRKELCKTVYSQIILFLGEKIQK